MVMVDIVVDLGYGWIVGMMVSADGLKTGVGRGGKKESGFI